MFDGWRQTQNCSGNSHTQNPNSQRISYKLLPSAEPTTACRSPRVLQRNTRKLLLCPRPNIYGSKVSSNQNSPKTVSSSSSNLARFVNIHRQRSCFDIQCSYLSLKESSSILPHPQSNHLLPPNTSTSYSS